MSIVTRILQKVLVNHFYKLNAGLFMFLFFVLFGLPQDVGLFHIALATIIIQNQVALLVIFVIWFLYNLKCIDYITRHLKEPQQEFLTCLQYAGFTTCFSGFAYVQFCIYLPVFAYAVFLIIIAVKHAAYLPVIEVLVFMLIVLLTTPLLYIKVLQRRFAALSTPSFYMWLRLPKTIFTLPLFYIWHSRKQMLLITKFFSLGILLLFIKVFVPDHYDIRPLLMCLLLSSLSNCAIIFEVNNFENDHLQFIKNFSFPLWKRFLFIMLMYCLLLLPELVFIWRAYPLHFHAADYPQLLLSAVALLVLLHTCLLAGNINMDKFIKIVFGIEMGLFFVILYNPGIALPICMLLIALGLFHAYYYEYEKE